MDKEVDFMMVFVVQHLNLRGEIHDLVSFRDFYEARSWASLNLLGWHVKEVRL